MPAGAFAVILLLHGVQILLPAPAFVEQGRVWAPARAVLQAAGAQVRWLPGERQFVVRLGEREAAFPELAAPWPVPATPEAALFARRQQQLLYVPLLAFRHFGYRAAWEPATRTVSLTSDAVSSAPLLALIAQPTDWAGRRVTLTGEYAGWDTCRFCAATRDGPPVGAGDWVLTTEDGCLYCVPAAATAPPPVAVAATQPTLALLNPGQGPRASRLPPLSPYGPLGRRVQVTGRMMLSPHARPYLLYESLRPLQGRSATGCRIVLDHQQRLPGQTMTWRVLIHNPGPELLVLPANPSLGVTIRLPLGRIHLLNLRGDSTAVTLLAGEEREYAGSWAIPTDAVPGTYSVAARLDDEVYSYPRHFEVVAGPSVPQ